MKLKKHLLWLLGFFPCILLSGCGQLNLNVREMMCPPVLSEEQKGLQEALKEYVKGHKINMVYPRTGKYTSPFIRPVDMPTTVFVLYSTKEEEKRMVTKMAMLKRGAEQWAVVSAIDITEGYNISVEEVGIHKLKETGNKNIIVSWQTQGKKAKEFKIFECTEELQEVSSSFDFVDKLEADIDDDGCIEIVFVDRGAGYLPTLYVLKWDGNNKNPWRVCSVGLKQHKSVLEHSRLILGQIKGGEKVVCIDEIVYNEDSKSEGLITEVVALHGKNLRNLIWLEDGYDLTDATFRDKNVAILGVDGDGFLAVPSEPHVRNPVETDASTLKLISWGDIITEDKKPTILMNRLALVNLSTPYNFRLPMPWWRTGSTASMNRDVELNVKCMYSEYEDGNTLTISTLDKGEKILMIYVVPRGSKAKQVMDIHLGVFGKYGYFARIYNTDTPVEISEEELRELFVPGNNWMNLGR
ncbi:MAG: hypothetical protein LBJ38_02535 [Oscillospiraceae bacterium]|jgi:hypothetical protein|nr:hypothetical protein [Oscillospiraceae bacterium]